MKINRIIALLACTMAFTACQDDMQEGSMLQNKIYSLTGKMSGGSTMSRAQIALGNTTSGSGETAYWNEDDEFTLYQPNEDGNWNEYVFSISDEYNESEKNPSVTFSTQYPANPGSYVAVYPAYRTVFDGGYVTCQISNYTSYNFVDQNPAEVWKKYFNDNMFMLAKGTLSGDGINDVSFDHLTSLFRISYTNASEESQMVKGISLGGDQHFRLWNSYSLETGEIVEEGGVTNDYYVWYDGITVEPGDTTDFYIFFFPTEFDEGDLDISFILGRGENDERKTVEIPMAYIAEKSHTEGFKAQKRYWFRITDYGKNICLDKDYTDDVVTIENVELSKVLQYVLQEQNIEVVLDEETGYATLSQMDANLVKELNFGYIGFADFTSLKGLEHFKNLKTLNIENRALQDTLDLSAFTRLEELYVGGNASVTEIVFPETGTLWLLHIANMGHWVTTQKIKELGDIFPNLCSLDVSSNRLTALDLSTYSNLEELLCYDNDLQVLDLSDRPKFRIVDCSSNENLTSLDLSGSTSLHKVVVQNCSALASLEIPNPGCVQILNYGGTQVTFTKADLETKFTEVNRLGCAGRFIGSLDIPDNMKGRLKYLDCQFNELTELDLTGYTELQELECSFNNLTSLNVSEASKLRRLRCFANQIDFLNISSLTALRNLECGAQNDNIELMLIVNESQKEQWNNNWQYYDSNERVYLEGDIANVETSDELTAALYSETPVIKFAADIELTAPLTINYPVILKMNGYKLGLMSGIDYSGKNMDAVITYNGSGELAIYDGTLETNDATAAIHDYYIKNNSDGKLYFDYVTLNTGAAVSHAIYAGAKPCSSNYSTFNTSGYAFYWYNTPTSTAPFHSEHRDITVNGDIYFECESEYYYNMQVYFYHGTINGNLDTKIPAGQNPYNIVITEYYINIDKETYTGWNNVSYGADVKHVQVEDWQDLVEAFEQEKTFRGAINIQVDKDITLESALTVQRMVNFEMNEHTFRVADNFDWKGGNAVFTTVDTDGQGECFIYNGTFEGPVGGEFTDKCFFNQSSGFWISANDVKIKANSIQNAFYVNKGQCEIRGSEAVITGNVKMEAGTFNVHSGVSIEGNLSKNGSSFVNIYEGALVDGNGWPTERYSEN